MNVLFQRIQTLFLLYLMLYFFSAIVYGTYFRPKLTLVSIALSRFSSIDIFL